MVRTLSDISRKKLKFDKSKKTKSFPTLGGAFLRAQVVTGGLALTGIAIGGPVGIGLISAAVPVGLVAGRAPLAREARFKKTPKRKKKLLTLKLR